MEQNRVELKDKVAKESGLKPGDPEYLGKYKKVTADIQGCLGTPERDRLIDVSSEWNEKSAPKEVQQRSVDIT